jgi:hypothetical protein
MTQKTLSSIIFLMIFSLASTTALAGGHTAKAETELASKEVKATAMPDHSDAGKKAPVFPEPYPKVPHGKAHVPQMEELPHIHKFHKERVKKMKKHHSKYWLLSQVLLALCHLSILVIGYLHATH